MINHPILFTLGGALMGFIIPEFFCALSSRGIKPSGGMKIFSTIGTALIAAAIAFR